MGDVSGRAVLVTGGGSGIGAATASRLVDGGADVMICGRRESVLRDVAASLGCAWTVADCTSEADVARAVARTVDTLGSLTGVVTAAGAMFAGSVLDTSPADWDACLASNVTSAFLVSRAAVPHLLPRGGTIVIVSSIAALRSSPGSAAYAAAKAAAVSFGQSLAVEFGPAGLRTNIVCPGWVRTPMADSEMAELDPDVDVAYATVTQLVPQRRPAEPGEVAEAVAWLSGPASSYVNGAVLTVDGGTTLVDAGTVPFEFLSTPRR